jgi:hypothetical protein
VASRSPSKVQTSSVPRPKAFPVHDYWIEHKRALTLEMTMQRDAMFQEVTERQRSAFLGIDLAVAKVEAIEADLRVDAAYIVSELRQREVVAWRHIAKREHELHALQVQLDDQLVAVLERSKQLEWERSEAQVLNDMRRASVEEWAGGLQQQFLGREGDIRLMARNIEGDLSVLFASRRQEAADAASPVRHVRDFATLSFPEKELPRVIIGEPISMTFAVTSPDVLAGTPVVLTYLEGHKGAIHGNCFTTVNEDGSIVFTDVRFSGPAGTSHIILVSIPRVSAGTVAAAEVIVHLKAVPDVRAVGAWDVDKMTLTGRLRVHGVEPFGLVGAQMPVVMTHHPSYRIFEVVSTANEVNEFPFQLTMPRDMSWDDVCAGKIFLEANIPASKYNNPFFHKFQVVCHSDAYPSFQFPSFREFNLHTVGVDVPYSELSTEASLTSTGLLLATGDVTGAVTVYRFLTEDSMWDTQHRIEHSSFVSSMAWSRDDTHLALLEPRRQAIHVWSVADLSLAGSVVAESVATPTTTFTAPLGTSKVLPIVDSDTVSCLVVVNNSVSLVRAMQQPVELTERRTSVLTAMTVVPTKKYGNVLVCGYANGDVIIVGIHSRKLLYSCTLPSKDAVSSFMSNTDLDRIVVASKSSLLLVLLHPSWAAVPCGFRSPSPIQALSAARNTKQVLVLCEDGNACVVNVDDARVVGFAPLGAAGLSSLHGAPTRTGFRVTACSALRPTAWQMTMHNTDPEEIIQAGVDARFQRKVGRISSQSPGGATPRTGQHTPRAQTAGARSDTKPAVSR